jgi:hypothetical protein
MFFFEPTIKPSYTTHFPTIFAKNVTTTTRRRGCAEQKAAARGDKTVSNVAEKGSEIQGIPWFFSM